MMSTDIQVQLKALGEQLEHLGIEHDIVDNAAVVVLPGEKKLKTVIGLTPTPGSLHVKVFAYHAVKENHEAVYKWLLQHNCHLLGVGYAIDAAGDICLAGQLPAQFSDNDLDCLLGQLSEMAGRDFNQILKRDFASTIKREWGWRVDRGRNLAGLGQSRHMIEQPGVATYVAG